MPEVPYLAEIAEEARSDVRRRLPPIAAELQRSGIWQEVVEWRISTETVSRIQRVEHKGRFWFEVSVTCDADLCCHTSTLERAIEYMGVFERLTRDFFWTLGWPSWAARSRAEPAAGETTP